MKIGFLRRITPFISCLLFTVASGYPTQAASNKAEIDNYARANGFPRSDYPYYENVNGCGGEGWSETAVRDSWGKVSFREACNNHDRCYMTLGSDVNACDDNFYKDLRSSCERDSYIRDPFFNEKIPDPATLSACYLIATTYYGSVRAVGWDWHQGAQAKARRYNDAIQNFLNQASPAASNYQSFPSPDQIPLTNLQTYADRRGAIAAFVNGHWNGNTGRYNVILITGGAQRIHDVSFDELGISLGTPPDQIPLTNLQTYADRRGAIAAFVNGHWNGNTGRYNVILITGGAQRIHDVRFDELGVSVIR
jgi:hypothetical protein